MAQPGSPGQGLEHIFAVIGRKKEQGRPVTRVRTYGLFADPTTLNQS